MPELAVSRDNVNSSDVIKRQAKAPRQAPETAAQGQTANTCMRDRTSGGYQTQRHRFMIELTQQAAAGNSCRA